MNKTTGISKVKPEKKKKRIPWRRVLPFYLMAFPGIFYLIINNYVPMFGVVIAFKKLDFRKGILGSDWVGLKNFRFLFMSPDAWSITRNTIFYNIIFWIIGTICAIALAILINEIVLTKVKKVYQSLILMPYLMSWVVVSYLANAFLASSTGFINKGLLEPLGIQGPNWYGEPNLWPFILLFFHVWKGVGYSLFIYLSSIVGISTEYFEAARIDGATKVQQIRYITLPLLKGTVITLAILAIGGIMYSDFGLFYQLPRDSGLLYNVTRTLDVYVFQALMERSDYALSSAASFYQSIIGLILIVVSNKLVKKYESQSALF